MLREILVWPNDVLHRRSAPAEDVASGKHDQLVLDMLDTMYDAGGIGLAAIQVAEPVRLFVMDVTNKDWVFFNPEIVVTGGGQELKNEGCLSLPGVCEQVMRWNEVEVRALDRNGVGFTQRFRGLEAQCVQHETEHLDGVVLPDKFGAAARERIRRQIRKRQKP